MAQHDDQSITHTDKIFTNINNAGETLKNSEFINCSFINCDFTKSILSYNDFVDCQFTQCNFSLCTVVGTGFKDARFYQSKIMGVDFTKCNKFMFSFHFQDCTLDYSVFYGTKLRKTSFINCSLREVDFETTDLTAAQFLECDMTGTRFMQSTLEKVDFRTALNFNIDPETKKLKRARFSALNLSGLLLKYNLDIDYNE